MIGIDELAEEISKICKECLDLKKEKADELIERAAEKMVEQLHGCGVGGKKYARAWTLKVLQLSANKTYIIHNKKPQLPHLLERGTDERHTVSTISKKNRYILHPHSTGSMPAQPHIKTICENVKNELLNEIKNI